MGVSQIVEPDLPYAGGTPPETLESLGDMIGMDPEPDLMAYVARSYRRPRRDRQ